MRRAVYILVSLWRYFISYYDYIMAVENGPKPQELVIPSPGLAEIIHAYREEGFENLSKELPNDVNIF